MCTSISKAEYIREWIDNNQSHYYTKSELLKELQVAYPTLCSEDICSASIYITECGLFDEEED